MNSVSGCWPFWKWQGQAEQARRKVHHPGLSQTPGGDGGGASSMIDERQANALHYCKVHLNWVLQVTFGEIDTVLPDLKTNLVGDVVSAGVLHLHHHIRMQEVGLDHVWYEGCVLLLEHDGDDVVAYVPLPLQLDVDRWTNLKTLQTSQITSQRFKDRDCHRMKSRACTEKMYSRKRGGLDFHTGPQSFPLDVWHPTYRNKSAKNSKVLVLNPEKKFQT